MAAMAHHLSLNAQRPDHPVCQADPRVKVVAAVILLVMTITSGSFFFPVLVSFLSLGLCLHIGVRPKVLLYRFSEPLFIASVIVVLKLLCSGTLPLFTLKLGGIELVGHRDGLAEGARIASRIVGAVSVLSAVGFSTQFTGLMAALSWFKVPQVLVDVALFAWRYLFLLLEEAQVVYQAQRNRLGYVGYGRGLRSMGTLAGVLVIKAFDNSQQITTAMLQRGYDGDLPLLRHKPFVAAEVAAALFLVAAMGAARTF